MRARVGPIHVTQSEPICTRAHVDGCLCLMCSAPYVCLQVTGGRPDFAGGVPIVPFAAGIPSVPGINGFTAITIRRYGAFSGRQWWELDLGDGSAYTTRVATDGEFADTRQALSIGAVTITAQELGTHTYASIGASNATLRLYDDPDATAPMATYTIAHWVRCC